MMSNLCLIYFAASHSCSDSSRQCRSFSRGRNSLCRSSTLAAWLWLCILRWLHRAQLWRCFLQWYKSWHSPSYSLALHRQALRREWNCLDRCLRAKCHRLCRFDQRKGWNVSWNQYCKWDARSTMRLIIKSSWIKDFLYLFFVSKTWSYTTLYFLFQRHHTIAFKFAWFASSSLLRPSSAA